MQIKLTQAQREELEKDAALKEERAFARIARQMEADLEARAKAQVDPPWARDADLGARRAPAFIRQLEDGETQLRERLQTEGLSYGAAELIVWDYQRQADAWGRAVQGFRPPVAVSQADIEALQQYLTSMVQQIIAQSVDDAVTARDVLRVKAAHVLTDWTRRHRKAPMDDAEADKRDAAALEKQIEARERPAVQQYLTEQPALVETGEVGPGGRGKVFRVMYPLPPEEDV